MMAGSDEHKKIAFKTYEKLLNSLPQANSVSGIPRLIDKDKDRD